MFADGARLNQSYSGAVNERLPGFNTAQRLSNNRFSRTIEALAAKCSGSFGRAASGEKSGTNGWSYDMKLVVMNLLVMTAGGGNLSLASEKNDRERDAANEVSRFEISKLNAARPVFARQHSKEAETPKELEH